MRRRTAIILYLTGVLLASSTRGQDLAGIAVSVADPTGAMVPGARVTLADLSRGMVRTAITPVNGSVAFDALTGGDYSLEVSKDGYNKYRIEKITVNLRARESVSVALTVGAAAGQTVNVVDRVDALSSDPAQGVAMDQSYVTNLPINGKNVESLVLMAPGMSTAAGGKGDGGFNANGLRSNMNYYTLDGVSMNQPMGGGGGGPMGGPGGGPRGGGGGGGPMPGGSGATEMISTDALQEMRVQTSTIAPEFGRSPGAQIVMTSRAGSNRYHGSLFYYFRNDKFDANDWFANAGGYGKGKESQNRPGFVFGGPIIKSKTFFFLSYEDLRLTSPETVIASVPSLATRASASAALRPYLNAFPLPNGVLLDDGAAQYRAVVSNPTRNRSVSLRIDHSLTSRINVFARYSITPPTSSERRGSDMSTPNLLSTQSSHSQTATVGTTRTTAGGLLNDLRVNFSNFSNSNRTVMDNYGGAVPLTDSQLFPKGVTSATGTFSLSLMGLTSYSIGAPTSNSQEQVNVVDSVSKTAGPHQLKAGVDFRRTMATNHRAAYSESVSFNGLSVNSYSFLTGVALNAMVSSSVTTVYPTYQNLSAYAQDAWRMSRWTTVTFGLRWDVNPAPFSRRGPQPFAISSDEIAGVTQNDPMYKTRWYNIAPRAGIAYNMDERRGREMMIRAGFGVFYDVGYGAAGGSFGGAPFSSVLTLSKVNFPLLAKYLAAPSMPPTRPYGQVVSADTNLKAPAVWQWNATWEKNFGVGTTLTLGYVGNAGRDLMRTETSASYTGAYDIAMLATNGASSSYNGFQMQFRKRMSNRLQMQLSYTWSHSIDSSSGDMGGGGGGFASLFNSGQRGSSDYDIRHNATLSGSYRLPAPKNEWYFRPFRNWFVDFSAMARTGLPFDLQGVSSSTSSIVTTSSSTTTTTTSTSGLFAQVRPSWNGYAIWVKDSNAPGGKRLNKDAFFIPSGYTQGNLSRNALRGFSAMQVDASLRRDIQITERFRLSLAAQGYNILNHPNFANPSSMEGANMSSPDFGVVTRMLNQGFGGGVNGLYRSGGARSMELSLRLQF